MILTETLALLVEKRDWFFELLLQHIGISLISIALAALIGLSLGIAIATWRRGAKPVLALVNFVYTIPSIALFGFLIPITGIGDPTAIVALTVYALLPIVRNTYTGLTTIDPVSYTHLDVYKRQHRVRFPCRTALADDAPPHAP